jgi:hypothetical protein
MLVLGIPHSFEGNAAIEGHEPSAVPHGETQQIDIANLARAQNEDGIEEVLVGDGDVVGPELMIGLTDLSPKHGERVEQSRWPGVLGLADDTNEPVLRMRAACPARSGIGRAPRLRALLVDVARVEERDEHTHIEKSAHAQ